MASSTLLTNIVCTIGPASATPEHLPALMEAGMSVARINFSHGTHESHLKNIELVRKIAKEEGRDIAILLDTKGPEIRTGDTEHPITVKAGEIVRFSSVPVTDEKIQTVMVNYPDFAGDCKDARCIIVDNGTLNFTLEKVEGKDSVLCKALQDGTITSRRHVNLPGSNVSLPSMMQKDWDDLGFGIKHEMDFVALSFIRTAKEVQEVVEYLRKHKSPMKVITKVETSLSVDNIDAIIAVSDGIMVARGDLGAELPFQTIPVIQDMIVDKCRIAKKTVIVATQMLESMIGNPLPTRAEVTDVAHAGKSRADSTMLSGESAVGKYPVDAVKVMSTILRETESHLSLRTLEIERAADGDEHSVRSQAAVAMAAASGAPAIVVLTHTGATAHAISMLKPNVPILAFAESDLVRRQLCLNRGVVTFPITFQDEPGRNVEAALQTIVDRKLLPKGSDVVVVSSSHLPSGKVNAVYLRTVG